MQRKSCGAPLENDRGVVSAKRTHQQRLGAYGEEKVAALYERKGYTIVGRNIRSPFGEVDLLAYGEEGCFIAIEVKTRSTADFGAAECIDRAKLYRVWRTALWWLDDLPCNEAFFDVDVRIDVVVVFPWGIEVYEDVSGEDA